MLKKASFEPSKFLKSLRMNSNFLQPAFLNTRSRMAEVPKD